MTKVNNEEACSRRKLLPFLGFDKLRETLDENLRSPKTSSYQAWKAATKRIQSISGGALVLTGNSYRGDDHRHQVIHKVCGNRFVISIDEINSKGTDTCPFCFMSFDLTTFGTIEALQSFVIAESHENAYFYANNVMGAPDEVYSFYCLRHEKPFCTTYSKWWQNRGETNACPECSS